MTLLFRWWNISLKKCINDKNLIGLNNYIKKCEALLEKQLFVKILLTNSGTDALEIACILEI